MRTSLLLLSLAAVVFGDLVSMACERNPSLPFCKSEKRAKAMGERTRTRSRSDVDAPSDPFQKRFEPRASKEDSEEEEIELLEEPPTPYPKLRRHHKTTPRPRQNHLYTIFPILQEKRHWKQYCPLNQYTFQVTCQPGKKLRYDLQLFCQEFSDNCGVPNTNLYQSVVGREDDGRPKGYGQKQKNGNLGFGRSFAFGLGALPGFEMVSSQGADIGNENLPGLNQIGGLMFNTGQDVGVMGRRIGKGPARSMNALSHGYPTLGLVGDGEPTKADQKAAQETLRSFGIPNVAGLGKLFQKLGGNRPTNRKQGGFEPGYGAVNKNAPLAFGKVDRDAVNLPGGMGDVEMNTGAGFGIGK